MTGPEHYDEARSQLEFALESVESTPETWVGPMIAAMAAITEALLALTAATVRPHQDQVAWASRLAGDGTDRPAR